MSNCSQCGAPTLPRVRFPLRTGCPACGQPILVVLSRDGVPLAFDPEPDGDGEHFNTILADDLSTTRGSADSAVVLADWKGRFTLYRSHFWTCPERMGIPAGREVAGDGPGVAIGGYWRRQADDDVR